jgi:hypothetical protein
LSKAEYQKKLQATGARMARALEAAYAPLAAQAKQRAAPSQLETCPKTLSMPSSNGLNGPSSHGSIYCSVGHFTPATPTQSKRIARLSSAAYDEAATALAALKPPGDAKSDNSKLVVWLREMGKLYQTYLTQPKTKFSDALKRLEKSPVLKAASTAQHDLQHKGYKLGAFASADASG